MALLIFLSQAVATADFLKLKSGKTQEGRILAESKGHVLFQDRDGTLSKIASSSISILDRESVSGNEGRVSFYTTSSKKKKKPIAKPILGTDQDTQETATKKLEKLLGLWLEKYPESKEWLVEASKEGVLKTIDMEGILAKIKKQS